MTMQVTTAHWTRTLTMDFWSQGKEKTLVRIVSPKKEEGTATLRCGQEIWNYLPKVRRVIKIPSSMMSASWMGSHFSNDDLVKEARMADDYTFELTFDGERDGERLVGISCIPKDGAAVVWGKVEVVARRTDYLPVRLLYYDEDLKLARTLVFSEIRELGGRRLPVRLAMTPADKPDESTVVIHTDFHFDVSLDDDVFTLRNLQR
jgi:outer membrane lipoprotein-sorting protein